MTEAGEALRPGTRLDEFEIERVLGAGGFGVTYLARDLSLDAWRAVKEYLPRDWGTRRQDGTIGPRTGGDTDDYTWGLERFLDEARILARFDHRHLVRVYRVFEARGTAYMVTEYVEGRTLAAEVEAEGSLAEARVREVLLALTDGLLAVHAAGLLHRDIKPGNVMVRPDGSQVLIDFGAARQAIGRHSRSVTAVLTPGYAPIEQYSARGNQGPWTDIYALGAVAYWALSGQAPEEVTERVPDDRLRPLAEVAPGVSAEFSAAVDAALAVDRRERPQSLDAWQALLEGRAAEESPGMSPERSAGGGAAPAAGSDSATGRRWWLTGAAVAGVALVAALAVPWNGTVSEEASTSGAEAPAEGAPSAVGAASGNELGPIELGVTGASGEALTPEPVAAANSGGSERDGAAPEGPGEGQGPPGEGAADADREGGGAAAGLLPAAVEEALGLDRPVRRVIQAGLAASGFDPGLADGLFGASTRATLREWQSASGVPATGYLDAAAVEVLRAAGEEAAGVQAQREAERGAEGQRQAPCAGHGVSRLPVVPGAGGGPGRRVHDGLGSAERRERDRRAAAAPGDGGRLRPGAVRGDAGRVCGVRGRDRARTANGGCYVVTVNPNGGSADEQRFKPVVARSGLRPAGRSSCGVRELGGRAGVCALAE